MVSFAKFCHSSHECYDRAMGTMNISLPDSLKAFVDEQIEARGFGTNSEYVRALIRQDQERQHLRRLLLYGAASPLEAPADAAYFDNLRDRVQTRTTG